MGPQHPRRAGWMCRERREPRWAPGSVPSGALVAGLGVGRCHQGELPTGTDQ